MTPMKFALALMLLLMVQASSALAIDMQLVKSPGGLEAGLVEDPESHVINLSFSFEGGYLNDPPGKQGMAALLSTMLNRAAGGLDVSTFNLRTDAIGLTVGTSVSAAHINFTVRFPSANRQQATELISAILNKPDLSESALRDMRAQMRRRIDDNEANGYELGYNQLVKIIFGNHPFSRAGTGTSDSLQAITTDDLKRLRTQWFNKETLSVGVMGNINAKELAPWLDELFSALSSRSTLPPLPAYAKPAFTSGVEVIRKNYANAIVYFGLAGLEENPDYEPFAARMVLRVLGGNEQSRLYRKLRYEEGLTYGVQARLREMEAGSYIIGMLETSSDTASRAVQLIKAELRAMGERGITQQELDDVKEYMIGRLRLNLTSGSEIANFLCVARENERGPGFLEDREDKIRAITLAQANAAAAALFKDKALQFIVVGNPTSETEAE
jgi:zinc protease